MLRVEEIGNLDELHHFRNDWKSLITKSKEADIFSTYEWITTWLDCFWKNKPISFFFIWDKSELIGLAPFLKDEKGDVSCKGSLINPTNGHTRRINIIISRSLNEILNALLNHIKQKRKIIRMILKNVISDSAVVQELKKIAKQHDLITLQIDKGYSPITRMIADWQTYLNSKSRHFSKELRRKSKKIKHEGTLEFKLVTETNHCEQAMQDIFVIERNSWKEKLRSSFTASSNLARFYKNVAWKSAQNGWLRIYLLYLNSRPIAHIYGLYYKNEYCALKTSYHESYKSLSPGAVLFEFALRDSFEQRFSLFDFFGTESRWKSEFANDKILQSDVCVFSGNDLRCQYCKVNKGIIKPFVREKMPIFVNVSKKAKKFFSLNSF